MILIIKGSTTTLQFQDFFPDSLFGTGVSITGNLLTMMIQHYLRKLSQKKISDLVCWIQNENKNEMSPCATSLSHQRPSFLLGVGRGKQKLKLWVGDLLQKEERPPRVV